MRFTSVLKVAGGISLIALAMSQAQAQAQEASAPADAEVSDSNEIVVTGTNIRGAGPAGTAVLSIGAAELANSGRTTAGDFLRELPSNFAGGVGSGDNTQGGQDASVAGSNLTGGQGVNLRGLGSLSTLVLVNGRRVAAAGQYGDFVDISTIPTAAISRIEVLQDGASAVYGSDAVGGVVNLILKDRDDGLRVAGHVGTTTQGGGTEQMGSVTYGTSWSGGHAFLGYEYQHRDRVRSNQRSIYNRGNFSDRGGINWPIYTARAGNAANIFSGTAAATGNVVYTVPGGAGTGLTAASLTPVTNGVGNTYDPWENIDILPETKRHSLFASMGQELTPGIQINADVRYSSRSADYNQGYATIYNTVPSTSPYYIAGVTNNFGVRIDDVGLYRRAQVKSFAAKLGMTAELGAGWRAEVTSSYSREDQRRDANALRDSNIYDKVLNGTTIAQAPSSVTCALSGLTTANIGSVTNATAAQRFCAGLNYTAFNPYTTNGLSQTVLDELIGYEKLHYVSWLAQTTAKVDGSLFAIPGGDVKVAAGADYRKEHIGGDLNFNYRSTQPVGVTYGTTEREVFALFGELAVPIVSSANAAPLLQALNFNAAIRYENGKGLGDFDTVNPKFGLDWSPARGLKFRGGWGTSFHAPPMRFAYNGVQPTQGGNGAFVNAGLYTAPCNTTLVRLNGVTGTPGGTGNCTFTAIVVSGGAGPTLRPEKAHTWTLGADFAPVFLPGLKLSASYFNIKIDDRIVRIQAGSLGGILASYFATGSSPYGALLDFSPSIATVNALYADPRFIGQSGIGPVQTQSDVAAVIYATQTNLASLKMDGLDFSADYRFDAGSAGSFRAFFNGTALFNYKIKATPNAAYVDQLGKYNSEGNPIEFRSRQGIGWDIGRFHAIATANYASSYECESGCYVPSSTGAPVLNTTPIKIKSYTTFDLSLSYELGGSGWLKDSALSLSVVNLTDKRPPFIDAGTAANDPIPDPYDAANATVIGRTLALSFTTKL
jgi:iron complex outermembrane recepter protein